MGVAKRNEHKDLFPQPKPGRGGTAISAAPTISSNIPIRQLSFKVEEIGNDEVVVYAKYNPGNQPKGEYPKVLCRLVDHLLKMTLETKNWR